MRNETLGKVQSDLAEERDHYAELYEFSPVARLSLDAKGRILGTNRAAATILGADRQALLKLSLSDVVDPGSQERCRRHCLEAFASGAGKPAEIEVRTADGTPRFVRLESVARDTRQGRVCFVALVDVTERRQAEAALRELNATLEQRVAARTRELAGQRERLQAILDTSPEAIITADTEGMMRSANAAAMRIFGYSEAEFIGRNISLLMDSPEREQHRGHLERYLKTGKGQVFGRGRDVIGLTRSGQPLPLHIMVSDVQLPEGRTFIALLRDLTEQRKLEEELRARLEDIAQMHRLHAVGEFAGLLAHQLNQPLAAIRGRAEALLARLRRGESDPARATAALETVVEQSERAAQTIRDLRAFISRQPPDAVECDINAVLNSACGLMGLQARDAGVRLTLELGDELRHVLARPAQVEQVLINLIDNALDAITETGRKNGAVTVRSELDAGGAAIRVTILDSGPGLDQAEVARVFEPLYTTKKDGMGMGLPISRSIVLDHGGQIWAEPGAGGCFRFTLPLAR